MTSKQEQVSIYIDQIGWGRYNLKNFAVCGLCWSTMLMWQCCISISLKDLETSWKLSKVQLGLIGSCHTFGVLLGSLIWGFLGDIKGRLHNLKKLFIIYVISGVFYISSTNLFMISLSGIFLGTCNGGTQVLTGTLYLETLPAIKKWTLVLLTMCISFGGIFAYLCAVLIVLSNFTLLPLWQCIGCINAVVIAVIWLMLRTIYESPKYLAASNQDVLACEVLEKIAESNQKKIDIKIFTDVEYISVNAKEISYTVNSRVSVRELFSPEYFSQTILITFGLLLSDVSYAALLAFMPILLSSIGTGIRSPLQIYVTILIQTGMGVPGSILSAYLAKTKIGKKWTVSVGFVLCGISVLLFLASDQYWMVLASTCCINLFNQMGYSSFVALTTESYSVELRALAVGWANAWCKFGGVLSPISIGFIFGIEGGVWVGVVILSVCFCGVGVIAIFLREPKIYYKQLG